MALLYCSLNDTWLQKKAPPYTLSTGDLSSNINAAHLIVHYLFSSLLSLEHWDWFGACWFQSQGEARAL
jgi:hypothetical protein